ncbi:hypothetical protein [Levilinea saccharolytica]|uniref:Quinate 5-dehydrogenase n=1 Tax=Levilinea saccharolytica TaxID=229921 RepID=A0A0P6XD64_9CHLR|nr:hypothetical protein [Levilinea saccharolytica]KPL77694.1 hypothetical protein ADN01_15655 [Levilinea saccharolytica]GAP17432.1 hypothetical protein LSAC_01303 [Levilinea saccharolytica]
MKRAVSISIGSSKRNKSVVVDLLGEKVQLERIGTDGDMEAAAQLYRQLDGQVDAFGVGGAVLGLLVEGEWHPLRSVAPMVRFVQKTPVVDGTGLKETLERQAANVVDAQLKPAGEQRRAFLISGVDRYGLTCGFLDGGYDSVIGDLMFVLGAPIPLHSKRSLQRVLRLLLPVVGRLPFSWLYPTGEKQEERHPRFENYFQWAHVVAGDCHYITHNMPERMDGKVIVTNTTTPEDRAIFRAAGVRHMVTTTPSYDGRTFGTNLLEAGILAAVGWKKPVDYGHMDGYLDLMKSLVADLDLQPQLQEL